MLLMSSDDDQVPYVGRQPFRTVSFRISPAGLYDGVYLLLRQKRRNAFLQITLKILLNRLRIIPPGQRSFISQPTRFVRRPITVDRR